MLGVPGSLTMMLLIFMTHTVRIISLFLLPVTLKKKSSQSSCAAKLKHTELEVKWSWRCRQGSILLEVCLLVLRFACGHALLDIVRAKWKRRHKFVRVVNAAKA